MESSPKSDSLPESLRAWLTQAVAAGASDLHLVVDYPPVMRLHGELEALSESSLTADQARSLLEALCPAEALARLETERNVDFSLTFSTGADSVRIRSNVFFAGRQPGACLRFLPTAIPAFEWAGFPRSLGERLAGFRDGLVIVTGATGSGKTTTLAMLVAQLCQADGYRIITVEDPIEYRLARTGTSVVTQREVGFDVLTFADGLRSGLRQDPDVILIGEIRDRETAQMSLSAAETGHLVLTSLHTRDTKGAISRYSDFFPQDVQSEIRSQLALGLRAVISQRLLPDVVRGEKRHLALEVLWNTHPIASGIRTGKLESIENYLLTHRDEGMLSFDESVRQLFRAGKIAYEVAAQNVREVSQLHR